VAYDTQNNWVFELLPSSGILEKKNVSETGSDSVFK
jgi:hypothetical protein